MTNQNETSLLRETYRAPEAAVMLLLSAAAALWAVHAGPFPGTEVVIRWPLLGSASVVVGWLGLYALLGTAALRLAAGANARIAAGNDLSGNAAGGAACGAAGAGIRAGAHADPRAALVAAGVGAAGACGVDRGLSAAAARHAARGAVLGRAPGTIEIAASTPQVR